VDAPGPPVKSGVQSLPRASSPSQRGHAPTAHSAMPQFLAPPIPLDVVCTIADDDCPFSGRSAATPHSIAVSDQAFPRFSRAGPGPAGESAGRWLGAVHTFLSRTRNSGSYSLGIASSVDANMLFKTMVYERSCPSAAVDTPTPADRIETGKRFEISVVSRGPSSSSSTEQRSLGLGRFRLRANPQIESQSAC